MGTQIATIKKGGNVPKFKLRKAPHERFILLIVLRGQWSALCNDNAKRKVGLTR